VGAVVGAGELPELDAIVDELVFMDYSVRDENATSVLEKYDKETERFMSRDLVEVRRRILERKMERKREDYKAVIETYETRISLLCEENENVLRQYESRVSQLYDSFGKEKEALENVIVRLESEKEELQRYKTIIEKIQTLLQ
jgi:predicted nucleic-acid-binding protein